MLFFTTSIRIPVARRYPFGYSPSVVASRLLQWRVNDSTLTYLQMLNSSQLLGISWKGKAIWVILVLVIILWWCRALMDQLKAAEGENKLQSAVAVSPSSVLDSVQLVETFSEGVLQKNLHHWSFLLPSLLLTFIYSQSSVTQVTLEWISPNFSSTRVSFLDPIVFAVTPNCLASFLIQLDFLFSDFQLLPLNYINDRLHSRKYGLVCSCNKYHS